MLRRVPERTNHSLEEIETHLLSERRLPRETHAIETHPTLR